MAVCILVSLPIYKSGLMVTILEIQKQRREEIINSYTTKYIETKWMQSEEKNSSKEVLGGNI